MNGVVSGVGGVRKGVHVCRGNWSKREEVHLEGDYTPMLPFLVQMEVDQLVLEMATPRAGEIDVFKEYGNAKELGLGVVNPRGDRIEDPAEIVARVEQLLEYFDPDKIFLNPDCGFGTFAERPLNPPEVAAAKLQSISTAAAELRARHG
jgi:5-methyltetrahydropteroyltriglutamate--homocysteine methyltransferase